MKITKKITYSLLLSASILIVYESQVKAQDSEFFDETSVSNNIEVVSLPKIDVRNLAPMFWTPQEIQIIEQIKKGIVPIEPIDEQSILDNSEGDSNVSNANQEADMLYYAPRQITLNGVVYKSKDDWVIWLNGLRITPKSEFDPLKSISVAEGNVQLKWYDALTDQIFPIKLKPHQKFDFDIKAFLPG
jgi:hypothetical protein